MPRFIPVRAKLLAVRRRFTPSRTKLLAILSVGLLASALLTLLSERFNPPSLKWQDKYCGVPGLSAELDPGDFRGIVHFWHQQDAIADARSAVEYDD